jgi:hypothetical protein
MKDFYTYAIKILRQDKSLRDHDPEWPRLGQPVVVELSGLRAGRRVSG